MKLSMVVSVAALALGVLACDRDGKECDEDRKPSLERGETTTRSGELVPAAPPGARDAAPPLEARGAPSDPRFDAARLSIVGSAAERDKNLGLTPPSPPTSPAVDAPAPAPQTGAGVIEPPPAPTRREGAGRPGAGGDPYQ
jgi:hypothetical protein